MPGWTRVCPNAHPAAENAEPTSPTARNKVLPASCWQSELTQKSQILRQDAGSTLPRPPLFDCRQNIRCGFAPGFYTDRAARIATRKTLSFWTAPTKNNSMSGILLSRLIEFALQTAILLGLLWGMIKIQKLDQKFEYNFLGLLGSAALATGLDQVLQMTLGHFGIYFASYISTPIVVTVLLLCLKKVTHALYVDVLFTVAISYALLFGVNLFILEPLMGNLRPSARNPDEFEIVTQQQELKKEHQIAIKTNLPAKKSAPPANSTKPAKVVAPMTNAPAPSAPAGSIKPAEKAALKTNAPAPSATTNSIKPATTLATVTNPSATITVTNAASAVKSPEVVVAKTNPPAPAAPANVAPPPPAKPVEVIAKYFAVRGVTRNAAKSAVNIQCGTKIYSIFLGETALTQTPDGPIPVHFKDLGDDWVVLEINGERALLPIH